MSLKPFSAGVVPERTATVARGAFPKGSLCIRIFDELGTIFQDQDFADLYSQHGQPGQPPFRLALVTVLQFIEGLSDRGAADAVRNQRPVELPRNSGLAHLVLRSFLGYG